MDAKVKEVLEKVKATAYVAGKAAGNVANTASKKAGEAFESTKLILKNFDLNTDIEILYNQIGKLVYLTHVGEDIDPEAINDKLTVIDNKLDQIEANKKQLAYRRTVSVCPDCSKECKKEDAFCSSCGYRF